MKKRIFSLILALAMAFTLVACGETATEAPADTPAEEGGNNTGAIIGVVAAVAVLGGGAALVMKKKKK